MTEFIIGVLLGAFTVGLIWALRKKELISPRKDNDTKYPCLDEDLNRCTHYYDCRYKGCYFDVDGYMPCRCE